MTSKAESILNLQLGSSSHICRYNMEARDGSNHFFKLFEPEKIAKMLHKNFVDIVLVELLPSAVLHVSSF